MERQNQNKLLTKILTVEQIKQELKECKISLRSNKTYYRWKHHSLGVVYDSLDTFYSFLQGVDHNDYFFVTPNLDLN